MKKTPLQSAREPLALESLDDRVTGLIRMILAVSALVIIWIDPSQPDRFVTLTYAALCMYSAYSAILFLLAIGRARRFSSLSVYAHWVDISCYAVLVALNSGTNSLFFFFFFFAITIASFRAGFAEGMRVTLASTILFTLIEYAGVHSWQDVELNRFLLRPVSLLGLGYMIAYCCGSELTLKRRLALLREVNRLSNPRFGADHTISSAMKQVRSFYNADTCLLIMEDEKSSGFTVRKADRGIHPEQAVRAESLTGQAASLLLRLPATVAVAFKRNHGSLLARGKSLYAYDFETEEHASGLEEEAEALADMLGARFLITLPITKRDRAIGRLFLTSERRRFGPQDVEFLRQAIEQIIPIIENIQLLDHLATEAAEHERQKISRDLHDSAVQPYIGLKLGLDALRRKVPPGSPVCGDIDELIMMVGDGISDLRLIVGGIRGVGPNERTGLLPALRQHAEKFSEFYHIVVDVRADADIYVNDRLAAEALQILREGLSNVRRHTSASRALISITCDDDTLVMQIENEREGKPRETFVPRSINERATALGGRAIIEQHNGQTIVRVEIPL